MNALAFESINQWKEVLNDTTWVKYSKHKKWPTVANQSMLKYVLHKWEHDVPYLMLLNQYKVKDESDNQWVKEFKGKRLCVIDGGDKPVLWKPFIECANVYIKENSYQKTLRQNVRIGCYCPSMKVPFLMNGIKWKEERKLDWLFVGDMHKGREKKINAWVNKVGGKYKTGDEHTYPRRKYLEMMSKTKMIPSFNGYGTRCRREWEALLCGGMLVNEKGLKDYPYVIMHPEEHFSFNPVWNRDIAKNGYDLAHKCFMSAPSIDIRMAALYMFFDVPQMWTYEDVEKKEIEYGLR